MHIRFGHICIFNKKNICLFSHVTSASDDEKMEELKKRINAAEKQNKALISFNNDLAKNIENRFKTAENKIELLRKTLEEKDKKISLLEVNITTLETALTGKLKTIEKHVTEKENKSKCDQCEYATTSEAGLKSHKSKKHKKGKDNAEIVFPKQCTLCDEI